MSDFLTPDDTRDVLRKHGGLLLGIGVLMWLLRKGGEMSDFVVFILLALPAVYLYGLGVFTTKETGGLRPWQAVYTIFGLIFVPLALFQFVQLVDGTPSNLNTFWIFVVTAALGGYAGIVAGVRYGLLLGAIAVIISWSGLWDKILGDEGIAGHLGVYRGLLGILAIILLAVALYIWRENPGEDRGASTATSVGGDPGLWKGSELLTGAGISAVIACGLGITTAASLSPLPLQITTVETNLFWDVALLLISLGLVGIGSQLGVRGPVYIGAIGLFLFLLIAGLDLNEGSNADPSNFGIWPLALLIIAAILIGLSSVKEASQGDKPTELVQKLRGG
jgi:hypothetical protein